MPKRDSAYMASRRREILEAAFRCLDRLGIAATSTTEICREAGISMGQLYTHFRSKEAVMLAIAELSAEKMAANMGMSTVQELRSLLFARLRELYRPAFAATIRNEIQLLAQHLTRREAGREVIENYLISRQMIHGCLERVQNAGGLQGKFDPETGATLLENFHYGLLFRKAAGVAEPRGVAEATLTEMLEAIAPTLPTSQKLEQAAARC